MNRITFVFYACLASFHVTAQMPSSTAQITPSMPGNPSAAVTQIQSEPKPIEDTPLQVIQKYTDEIRTIREDKTAADQKDKDQKIAERVRNFFDFQELGKLSLDKHWKQMTDSQKNEFTKIFVELLETSYLKKSRQLVGDYKLNFKEEKLSSSSKARVVCLIANKDADVKITYELYKSKNKWMIYNILLDRVNLLTNYRSQFNKIVSSSKSPKEGIKLLIQKMKSKLEDQKKNSGIDVPV